MKLTNQRSIGQINQKIENGEANIYTAEEFKKLIKEGNTPSFDEVDVVTAGTCGVMSGTAAILNFIVSEPGKFIRAEEVFLNGVPAHAGPCPNEWLGAIDVILHGTTHSIDNHNYGGGFVLKELLEGKTIDVRVESVEGKTIESNVYDNIDGKYDLIVTNPPIRAGKKQVYKILDEASNHLKDDGELWFVIRKEQGAKSTIEHLKERYQVNIMERSKGFFIIMAKKA